ncbi:Alpha/Beta hydrolase protein [Flagelloscypha sp. PMI_526]|nr:Alpha/Beta hydrolase protein [Flagelloscypha sp. PMI_526]
MEEHTITLSSSLVFGYYDSGVPHGTVYKTIFAIHGFMFNSYVWKKMMPLALNQKVRLVCINRRGHGKTTPLPKDQFPAPEKDNADVVKSIGLDILEFIHAFSQKEHIPFDDEQGGFALLSWSLGNMTGLSAVANIANASEEVQSTISHLKGLILHALGLSCLEPPQVALGLPQSKSFFYPDVLQLIPPSERQSIFHWWISGYFDHDREAIKAKSVSTPSLTYASPSPFTPPSIYNIGGKEEHEKIFQESGGVDMDSAFMHFASPELIKENYKKAVFESGLEEKTIFIISGRAVEQLLVTSWQAETDGMKMVYLDAANHFAMWDFPEETLKAYLTVL